MHRLHGAAALELWGDVDAQEKLPPDHKVATISDWHDGSVRLRSGPAYAPEREHIFSGKLAAPS